MLNWNFQSCWREKWLIVERFKRTKRSTQDICYIILNSYNLKDFFYVAHHEVVMFFYFAKSVTFYLYICISLKRFFLIVVVSNNKLFNRVSHNVVTWDLYLHLFIIPLLTHFFSHPRGFLAWKLQVIYYVKFDICYGFQENLGTVKLSCLKRCQRLFVDNTFSRNFMP